MELFRYRWERWVFSETVQTAPLASAHVTRCVWTARRTAGCVIQTLSSAPHSPAVSTDLSQLSSSGCTDGGMNGSVWRTACEHLLLSLCYRLGYFSRMPALSFPCRLLPWSWLLFCSLFSGVKAFYYFSEGLQERRKSILLISYLGKVIWKGLRVT